MTSLREQLLALGITIDAGAELKLLQFLDELLRWNRTHNLTALRDWNEALEKHLVDSLTVLPLLHGDELLLDLGSGGGFPSLPLKIVCPGLTVVSVDSVAKKINFQRHAARLLGLEHFTALQARAEELPRLELYRPGFQVVVARAFTSLPALAALAAPLLRPEGRLIAMKGPEGDEELRAARDDLQRQGLEHRQTVMLTLPVSQAQRRLLVLEKVG